MADQSDIYCAAPFISRSYAPDGKLHPCCEWGAADDNGRKLGLTDSDMAKVRQDMLANRPNRNCKVCYQTEAAGGDSMRMDFNDRYGRPTEPTLKHLDFSLGNLCNFKCRMCNSLSSSKWAADSLLLGEKRHPLYRRKPTELINMDLSGLDMVKFKGGETLLEQETMIELLQMFISQSGDPLGLTVTFNTNGSQEISTELLGILSDIKSVRMTVSVDGMGKTNDYQRTGSSWPVIERNLINWSQTLPFNFSLSIYSVWSILNLHGAIELMEWASAEIPRYEHFGTALFNPPALGIRNVPSSMKAFHYSMMESWTKLDHVFNIAQQKKLIMGELIMDSTVGSKTVLEHINILDKLRKERFELVDPDMYQALLSEG